MPVQYSPRSNTNYTHYSPGKVVATRVTLETLTWWLLEFVNLGDQPWWQQLTHLIFDGLRIDNEGQVVAATSDRLLDCTNTYRSTVLNIIEKHPHINLVYSCPSYGDMPDKLTLVRQNGRIFWQSFMEVWESHRIQAVEMDYHILEAATSSDQDWQYFITHVCHRIDNWYVSISNTRMIMQPSFDHLKRLDTAMNPHYVVRSYGFIGVEDITTGQHVYRQVRICPDSVLGMFSFIFRTLCALNVHSERIIMDMDTRGLEFMRSPDDPTLAMKIRLVSLRDIRHRKLMGHQSFVESFEAIHVSCLLDFPFDNTCISFDNHEVRTRKLDFILANKMAGIMIGPMQDDVFPTHPDSLLSWVSRWFSRRVPA